jgi:BioD-like phosphotransacetylase family protein
MRVYIAATRQNDGKTIVALGLLRAFQKRMDRVGYIKPVGQHYLLVDGAKIDKDAVLMKQACGLEGRLEAMSPVAIPRGFTEEYIINPQRQKLVDDILQAYTEASSESNVTIVEGTGHAGVGAVFDMSNADVASLLDAPVVLVSCGGVGKPIDEIMLNKASFDAAGVEILGCILNKVMPDKYDKVSELARKGLERKGLSLLGVVPYDDVLSSPTVEQVMQDVDGELLSGAQGLRNRVMRVVIGAMPPHEALNYFGKDVLLVTPGNREDLILAAMSSCVVGVGRDQCVSGIVLTCGIRPHPTVMRLIERTFIPVVIVPDDTFSTASKIDNLIVKLRPGDRRKLAATEQLIERYVDVDRIQQMLEERQGKGAASVRAVA